LWCNGWQDANSSRLKNRFSTFLTNSSWKFWIHLLSWKGIISFFLFCKEKTKKSEHASWGLFLLCVAIDYDSSLKERRLQIQPSWTEITHADSVACLLNTTWCLTKTLIMHFYTVACGTHPINWIGFGLVTNMGFCWIKNWYFQGLNKKKISFFLLIRGSPGFQEFKGNCKTSKMKSY
jgi:hypothetical protein